MAYYNAKCDSFQVLQEENKIKDGIHPRPIPRLLCGTFVDYDMVE